MKKLLILLILLTSGSVYAENMEQKSDNESSEVIADDNNSHEVEKAYNSDNESSEFVDAENFYMQTYLGSKYDIYAVDYKSESKIVLDPHMEEDRYYGKSKNVYIEYLRSNADEKNTILVIETALMDVTANMTPYNIELTSFGYNFNPDKDPQISCNDNFIAGRSSSIYEQSWYRKLISHGYEGVKNRALLKAVDYLKTYIDKGEYGTGGYYLLYTALAVYSQDGLYNLDELKKYAELYKKNRKEIEFDKDLYAVYFEPFILKMAEVSAKDVVEFYHWAEKENVLNFVLFNNGYFDIYNDGIYHKVLINKVKEQSIILIFDEYLPENIKDLFARYYYKVIGKGNQANPLEYPGRHCTNNVYFGNLYIMPFNKAAYIINRTEVENKLNTIEIRNPAYFNTEYGNNYFGKEVFKNHPEEEPFRRVSQMETFAVNGSVIYEKIYERDIMSAAGDVDTLKDRLDYNSFIPYQNMGKGISLKDYLSYLKGYTDIDMQFASNCYFYNISKTSTPVYLAYIEYAGENQISLEKRKYFFILDRNLKILNKDLAKEMNDFVYNTSYYKTVLTNINNNPHVVLVRRDGEVFVINIQGEKTGYAKFPAYYYKNEKEKTNPLKDKTTLLGVAELDCSNAVEEKIKMICSNRQLLTYRAYIDILFDRKMKKAEANNYPANVIDYYNQQYSKIIQDYGSCGNSFDCYIKVFRKYEEMFIY